MLTVNGAAALELAHTPGIVFGQTVNRRRDVNGISCGIAQISALAQSEKQIRFKPVPCRCGSHPY